MKFPEGKKELPVEIDEESLLVNVFGYRLSVFCPAVIIIANRKSQIRQEADAVANPPSPRLRRSQSQIANRIFSPRLRRTQSQIAILNCLYCTSFADSVISNALSARETGQLTFASLASSRNFSSVIPGTFPVTSR